VPKLAPGDRFPELVLDSRAGPVTLSDRYRGGPLVAAFMRHFG
jgi:hypothetical protein